MRTRDVVISVSLPATVRIGQAIDLPAGRYPAADLRREFDIQPACGEIVGVSDPYGDERMACVRVAVPIPPWAGPSTMVRAPKRP